MQVQTRRFGIYTSETLQRRQGKSQPDLDTLITQYAQKTQALADALANAQKPSAGVGQLMQAWDTYTPVATALQEIIHQANIITLLDIDRRLHGINAPVQDKEALAVETRAEILGVSHQLIKK